MSTLNIEALRFQVIPQELLAVEGIQTLTADRVASHYRLKVRDVRVQEGGVSVQLELSAKVDKADGRVLEWKYAPNHPEGSYLNLQGWVSIPEDKLTPAELIGLIRFAEAIEQGDDRPDVWMAPTEEGVFLGGFQFTLKQREVKFSKENVVRTLYCFDKVAFKNLSFCGSGISQGSNLVDFEDVPPVAAAPLSWGDIYQTVAAVAPAAMVEMPQRRAGRF
jgi:hypothetical protein